MACANFVLPDTRVCDLSASRRRLLPQRPEKRDAPSFVADFAICKKARKSSRRLPKPQTKRTVETPKQKGHCVSPCPLSQHKRQFQTAVEFFGLSGWSRRERFGP